VIDLDYQQLKGYNEMLEQTKRMYEVLYYPDRMNTTEESLRIEKYFTEDEDKADEMCYADHPNCQTVDIQEV